MNFLVENALLIYTITLAVIVIVVLGLSIRDLYKKGEKLCSK